VNSQLKGTIKIFLLLLLVLLVVIYVLLYLSVSVISWRQLAYDYVTVKLGHRWLLNGRKR